MKNILVINDHSHEAEHAARMGLLIAQNIQADLLVANCFTYTGKLIEKTVAGSLYKDTGSEHYENDLHDELDRINHSLTGFKPKISTIDLPGASEGVLAGYAIRNQVDMIIRGVMPGGSTSMSNISSDSLLKKINCPLLLVPYGWHIKDIQRLCYIAELRYCRLDVVRYLARFAAPWRADVSIAHLCARGLAEMETQYAESVFEREILQKVSYARLLFTPVSECDVRRAVDVFIHGMGTDMLVLVNQCFHFQDVLGGASADSFPAHLTVPLLVFP
ncbi:hypothetical protein BEL04_06430 [Mucilaginibacter sp. PPCGB 2223]|uniref:universal stress protein n=1 Tax=Mucilaginibacter sp. PPCGB 2223 TaxID=1886027 RepID=UPI0008267D0E|nr:universal stress protein [Mucilaginibacter sp. PPCGB 2223]OCX53913.1 hypothetical protein BEL04_06430 [Mucilaginibacter sp. PPCGB 2223]